MDSKINNACNDVVRIISSNDSISPSKRELQKLLNEHTAIGDRNANIIDQGVRKNSYKVPIYHVDTVFNLMEACRLDNSIISNSEKQTDNSCLWLDFDFKQDSKTRVVSVTTACNLMQECVNLYASTTCNTTERIVHYSVSIRHDTEQIINGNYKDGIHGRIYVRMTKQERLHVCKLICESKIIQDIFGDSFINGDSAFDKNSASVPVLFHGNCKKDKRPYEFVGLWSVAINNSMVTKYYPPTSNLSNINLTRELSLGFSENKLVNSEPIPLNIVQGEYKFQEEEYEEEFLPSAPAEVHMREIIDILHQKRVDDHGEWFKVMCALANTGGEHYKNLASYFTKKRRDENGRLLNGRTDFEKTWAQAMKDGNRYKYSKWSIYKMAKEDNLDKYNAIENTNLTAKLVAVIHDDVNKGEITDNEFAQAFHTLFADKYKYDSDADVWYTFIDVDRAKVKGEGGKWKLGAKIELSIDISRDLVRPFKVISTDLKHALDAVDPNDEVRIKYYSTIIKELNKSIKRCGMNGAKKSIIEECKLFFDDPGFSLRLDADKDDIGVGNGVLHIGKKPILTQTNESMVSRYVNADWDPDITVDSKEVYAVFNSIYELFSETEKDAFQYIMFYLSTALTGHRLCKLLILTGAGSNGKTYIQQLVANMLRSAIGSGYSSSLNIQYLTTVVNHVGKANPELFSQLHSRFTYMSESNKSEFLNVAALKQLVSHDTLQLRALHKNSIEANLEATPIMITNYPARLNSTKHSDTKRIGLYELSKKIVADPTMDYELKQNSAMVEEWTHDRNKHTAIFNILVRYRVIWLNRPNFDLDKISPTVAQQTKEWLRSDDIIGNFISACIVEVKDKEHKTPMTEVVDAYIAYYTENIKKCNFDRSDITNMLADSSIGKFVRSEEKNVMKKYLAGHKPIALDAEPSVEAGERYISANRLQTSVPTIDRRTSAQALEEMLREYNSYVN